MNPKIDKYELLIATQVFLQNMDEIPDLRLYIEEGHMYYFSVGAKPREGFVEVPKADWFDSFCELSIDIEVSGAEAPEDN